jgi:hypothetical protein
LLWPENNEDFIYADEDSDRVAIEPWPANPARSADCPGATAPAQPAALFAPQSTTELPL